MAMQIEKAGVDLAVIYRPLNNIYQIKQWRIRINEICKNKLKKVELELEKL